MTWAQLVEATTHAAIRAQGFAEGVFAIVLVGGVVAFVLAVRNYIATGEWD